jgi:hypothetical protein
MDPAVIEIIREGGTVALALVVVWHLRSMATALRDLRDVAVGGAERDASLLRGQRDLAQRQRELARHLADHPIVLTPFKETTDSG